MKKCTTAEPATIVMKFYVAIKQNVILFTCKDSSQKSPFQSAYIL